MMIDDSDCDKKMDEKLTVVNPLIIEVLDLDIRSPSYSGTSSRGPNVDSNLTLSHRRHEWRKPATQCQQESILCVVM